MKILTKAFGEMDIDDRQIIHFPHGVLGFDHLKEFALIDSKQPPFFILQSLAEIETAFIIISPEVFRTDYELDFSPGELDDLNWDEGEDLLVMAIVTIPKDSAPITANLQGPILINRHKRLGKQAIQIGSQWKTRHNVLDEMAHVGAE